MINSTKKFLNSTDFKHLKKTKGLVEWDRVRVNNYIKKIITTANCSTNSPFEWFILFIIKYFI
jgi:hypothetical protein